MEQQPTVEFARLHERARLPAKAHATDAAYDLFADAEHVISPSGRALVGTGVRVTMPSGLEGQIRPRSGLALEHGVTVLNAPGTIDPGYTGEIGIILINHGASTHTVRRGDRIAQILIAAQANARVCGVEVEADQPRGDAGFGSSGA